MRWLWEPDDERDNDHRTRPGSRGGGTLVTCSAPRWDRSFVCVCVCACVGVVAPARCVCNGDDDGDDNDDGDRAHRTGADVKG